MNQWFVNRLTGLVFILLGGISLLYPPGHFQGAAIGQGFCVIGCLFLFFPYMAKLGKWVIDKFNAPYKPPRR